MCNDYINIFVHEVYIKSSKSQKFSYIRQSDVYETLALAVFDYEDPKSQSWHRAKKNSRSIFGQQIGPHTSFRTKYLNNRVNLCRCLGTKIKLI